MDKEAQLLADILYYRVGESEAIPSKDLQDLFSCSGKHIRDLMHVLRLEGYPICSGFRGYWIADNIVELRRTIKQLSSRRDAIDDILEVMREVEREW